MNRFIATMHTLDRRLFYWINHKWNHNILGWFLAKITHLGGATFSIIFSLSIYMWAPDPWKTTGLQSMIALTASHIPVAIFKRKLHRLRPYLVLPKANVVPKPLKDHSFPSGHTTAIFSVTVPFMIASPLLSIALLPLAVMIGLSRIYLGLHYPSDVIAGGLVGTTAAAITASAF